MNANSYRYANGLISVYPIHFDWNGKTGWDARCVSGSGLIAADKQTLVNWALSIEEIELAREKNYLNEVRARMRKLQNKIDYLKTQKI